MDLDRSVWFFVEQLLSDQQLEHPLLGSQEAHGPVVEQAIGQVCACVEDGSNPERERVIGKPPQLRMGQG